MKISSKYLNVILTNALRNAVDSNSSSRNKMMYLTSYGFVSGIPKNPLSQSDNVENYFVESLEKSNDLDLNIISVMKEQHLKKSDIEINLIGDGSFVILSDVKIYHGSLDSPVLTLKEFMLHTEDIIGITYIPVDSGL